MVEGRIEMRVVYCLVFWTRALASSAASMASLLVLVLSCIELVHRAPHQATLKERTEVSREFSILSAERPFELNVSAPRPSPHLGRFDSIIAERVSKSSRAVRAAKFCDFRTFEDLIDNGSNVFAIDGNGELPLAWAVRSNCREIITQLLRLGADIQQPEGNGLSPLDWAKKENNVEIISLFHEEEYPEAL